MTALPEAVLREPIVGWRAWRVFEIDTLRNGRQFRLCAVGTNGIPKVWEPRAANRAVCSDFASRHEAPDPEHECGLYALRSRKRVDRLVAGWVKDGQDESATWAIGRVSLWGRVTEWEKGWRGEYAYPYALTVHSDDERIGQAIRDLYLIDVEHAPAIEPPETGEPSGLLAEVTELAERIEQAQESLEELAATLQPRSPARERTHRWVAWDLRISSEPSDPRLLEALRKAIAADGDGGAVPAFQVAEQLPTDDGDDPTLPLAQSCVTDIALLLKGAALRGDVIQLKRPIRSHRTNLKRPATHTGSSLWTLPGIELSEKLASSYSIFENEPDQLEQDILAALTNAVGEANGEPVGIGAVLSGLEIEAIHSTSEGRTKIGEVAARLSKLEKRGLVKHDGCGSKPKLWTST